MRFPALTSLRRGWRLAAVAALIALAALLTGGPEPAQAHDGTEGHAHFAPFLDGCGSCPDAPTGYAEPGIRGEIKVQWTPATTGVAATSWHIRYTRVTDEDNPFNQPQNVTHISHPASARSYTISGLEPGVQYAVLIMGWGGNGYGDAAVASLAAGAVPLPGPPFFDARVTGDILRIRIKGDLDTGSVPAGSAFKVTASQYGVTRTINGSDAPIRSLDPVRIMDASFANFRFTYVYVMLTESVRRGETVTVSYTRPTQNPLQDRSGNRHTYSFSNKPAANRTPRDSSDTTPPTFTSAEVKKPSDRFAVTETTLLVTFNQNLDLQAAGTAGSAFSVTVTNPNTGAARTIEGKGTVGTGERNNLGYLVPNAVANVTLDGRILRTETVTVSYTQPTENPLQDENGNPVATFTGRTVSNNVPLPMATRAQVLPNGQSQYNRLIVTFDQELDDNSSPASAFVMTSRYTLTRPIDGVQVEREHTHTGTGTLSISGRTLEVTLDSPMQPIAEFTVKYTKPSSGNKLRDTVRNEAPSFTLSQGSSATFVVCSAWGNYALSGGRADISPIPCDMAKPAWNFGEGGDGSIVWLYSEANPAPPVNQPVESVVYTIPGRPDHRAVRDAQGDCYREERVNGQWQRSTSYGSNEESCRQASWNAYNRAMGLLMVNPDGGTFPSGPAPVVATLDSAAVNEKTLKLTFDRSLDAVSLPAPSAFTVTEDGARRSVAAGGVAVSGQTVTLTLTAAVDPGTKVTARYTKPTANPLRTAANGIDVEGFTDQSVTNNTQDSHLVRHPDGQPGDLGERVRNSMDRMLYRAGDIVQQRPYGRLVHSRRRKLSGLWDHRKSGFIHGRHEPGNTLCMDDACRQSSIPCRQRATFGKWWRPPSCLEQRWGLEGGGPAGLVAADGASADAPERGGGRDYADDDLQREPGHGLGAGAVGIHRHREQRRARCRLRRRRYLRLDGDADACLASERSRHGQGGLHQAYGHAAEGSVGHRRRYLH